MENLPTTPIISESDKILALQLYRSPRVGPQTYRKLIEAGGSLTEAFDALLETAAAHKVKGYKPFELTQAEAEYEKGIRLGGELLIYGDPHFPAPFASIDSAPPVFWCKGNPDMLSQTQIAIVGSRNASALGIRTTSMFARELAGEGYIITSGLARGIDTAAHIASISLGTIGVVAGGFDINYPTENARLQQEIGEYGCLVAELPPGHQPQNRNFPQRNRIIAALSTAVLVVEGNARSGSMITASFATDMGKDILAVPGHPFEGRASGPNNLIRDGAVLVRNTADVVEALTGDIDRYCPEPPPKPTSPSVSITALQHAVHTMIGFEAISESWLADQMDVPVSALLSAISELEIKGQITRLSGGKIARS